MNLLPKISSFHIKCWGLFSSKEKSDLFSYLGETLAIVNTSFFFSVGPNHVFFAHSNRFRI